MDFVRGRVFKDPALPGLQPAERTAIYETMVDTLAKIHKVNIDVPELADYGKKGAFVCQCGLDFL